MTRSRKQRPAALLAAAILAGGALGGVLPVIGARLALADESFSFARLAGADRYATAARLADAAPGSSVAILATAESFGDALAGSYLAGVRSAPLLLTTSSTLPPSTAATLDERGVEEVVVLGGTGAVGQGVEDELEAAGYTVTRLAGADRYATARLIAEAGGSGAVGAVDGQRTAIVASGASFADATAAGPLAYAGRLPILLTPPDRLSSDAAAALQNLEIDQALVLGGTAAVGSGPEAEIVALGIDVTRLAGTDRTATAVEIADYAIEELGFPGTEVSLARGDAFADALAGGPYGGRRQAATLLTASPTSLGAATERWLADHGADLEQGTIFGGTGAVSSSVEAQATKAAGGAPAAAGEPPVIVLSSGPADAAFTNDSTPTYGGSASVDEGDVDRIEASLDGGAFSSGVTCRGCGTEDATWQFTPSSPLGDGNRSLAFRAATAGGAPSEPVTARLTVDTKAPTFDAVTARRGTSVVQAVFSEPVACSTVSAADFAATVASSAATVQSATCSGTSSSSVDVTLSSTLSTGQTVQLTLNGDVADRAGTPAPKPTARSVVVPAADPPSVTVASGPAHGGFTNQQRPTWQGSAAQTGTEKVTGVEVRLDGGAFTAVTCNGCPAANVTWAYTIPTSASALTDGSHTAEFRATNDAQVPSILMTRTFTVDTAAPVLASFSAATRSTTVSTTFTDADGVACSSIRLAGVDPSFTVEVGGSPSSVVSANCAAPTAKTVVLTIDRAPLGGESVAVGVVQGGVRDRAGNASVATTRPSATMSNAPPVVTISNGPPAFTNDSTAQFGGSATDPDGNVKRVQAQVDNAAFTDVPCAGCPAPSATWTFSPALADGSHTVTFRSVDNTDTAGGTSNVVTRAFTVDTVAPDFADLAAVAGDPSLRASFSEALDCATVAPAAFDATVAGAAVEVTDTACDGAADDVIALTLATAPRGHEQVRVSIVGPVTDPAGNAATGALTALAGGVRPTVTITTDPVDADRHTNANSLPFGGSANDADGAVAGVEVMINGVWRAASCALCGGGSATVEWSAEFAGADLPPGIHTVEVRAVDATGLVGGTVASDPFTIDRTSPVLHEVQATALTPAVKVVFDDTSAIDCEEGEIKSAFLVTFDGSTAIVVRAATCDAAKPEVTLDLVGAPPPGTSVRVSMKRPVYDLAGNESTGFSVAHHLQESE